MYKSLKNDIEMLIPK